MHSSQVSRELPRTARAEIEDVREDPSLARGGLTGEREGLATPKGEDAADDFEDSSTHHINI